VTLHSDSWSEVPIISEVPTTFVVRLRRSSINIETGWRDSHDHMP